MTAFGLRPSFLAVAIPRASDSAVMLKLVSSTSTNSGVAPVRATGEAVAQNVNDGQNTASPGPAPIAISTMTSASVPLAQVMTCLAPQNSDSAFSSATTPGPLTT